MKLKFLFGAFLLLVSFVALPELLRAQITIENSNLMSVTPRLGTDVQLLKGNVRIRTQGAILYCDSAYYYFKRNSFIAFGRIKMVKNTGDGSLTLTCLKMNYNGSQDMMEARDSVVLLSQGSELRTNFFDFDFRKDVGHFYNGGTTIGQGSKATSREGYFYQNQNKVTYLKNVVLVNDDFTIHTDTIIHNTQTEVSFFKGPTNIYQKDGQIYCTRGYSMRKEDATAFAGNPIVINNGQRLTADSIYYNRKNDIGYAFGKITMIDTAQNTHITGNYMRYSQNPSRILVADKALMLQISDKDTTYLHGDTLVSTYEANDTAHLYRIIKAYHKVKIFNNGYQAMADSMYYSQKDSIIRLIRQPALWADNTQLTSDEMWLFNKNNKMERIDLRSNPLIVMQEDSVHFSQIKGKKITAFLKDNKLNYISVELGAETIYFPKDGEQLIGVNRATSTNMKISMKDNKVDRIVYIGGYTGNLTPLHLVKPEETRLREFKWIPNFRPQRWEDVFLWEITAEDLLKRSRKNKDSQNKKKKKKSLLNKN